MADMNADAAMLLWPDYDMIDHGEQDEYSLDSAARRNDDLSLYRCDRDKAFDRVDHSWLVK